MEHFIHIITQPDNIAIVVMMVGTFAVCAISLREIILNDRLIKKGEKEKVYERMIK